MPRHTADRPLSVTPVPRPQARMQLICLHSAGSGPAMYRPWARSTVPDLEVVLAHLPGREARLLEEPWSDYATTVTTLVSHFGDRIDRPFAIFGHSMGALLALGLAAGLRSQGQVASRLIVSGCRAPQHRDRIPSASAGDDELVDDLRRQGGTAPEVLADAELLSLILPTLRADYRICASFQPPEAIPLPGPITVLGGEDDGFGPEEMKGWQDWTSADLAITLFPGGHFFLTGVSAEAVQSHVFGELLGDLDSASAR